MSMSLSFPNTEIFVEASRADPPVRAGPPGPALPSTKSGSYEPTSRRGRRLRTRGPRAMYSSIFRSR